MDRGFDAQVERTKGRPLPSGRVTVVGASVFLAIQYVLAAAYFTGLKNAASFSGGHASTFATVEHLPAVEARDALAAGLPWIWYELRTHSCLVGHRRRVGPPIDGVHVTWLLVLDDGIRKDDVKAGVHSTAVLFGDYVSAFLNMNAVLFVSLLVVVGIINEQGPLYYAISCMGTACWLLWQSLNLELDNPASCWSKFFYIPFACIIAHGWVPQMPLWATVDLDG
ncbi:hypothetical protein EIP86_009507 [Pleurotus ostreatoroseus]|nr:hypothetical protein EIP86_009507 [Pleurotus ostreatoroseus]